MKKKRIDVDGFEVAYRSPRTRQEKRANIEGKNDSMIRSKRNSKRLTDVYDDHVISEYGAKTWKRKHKDQYREVNEDGKSERQGNRYIIEGSGTFPEFEITTYFTKHDIPFKIVNKSGNKKLPIRIHFWTNKNIDIERVLKETNPYSGAYRRHISYEFVLVGPDGHKKRFIS